MISAFKNFKAISLEDYRTSTLIAFSTAMAIFAFVLIKSAITPKLEVQSKATARRVSSKPSKSLHQQLVWQSYKIKPGENLFVIFKKINLPQAVIYQIIKLGEITKPLAKIKANTTLDYAIDHHGHLVKLEYQMALDKKLVVQRVSHEYRASIVTTKLDKRIHYTSAEITSSLNDAGIRAGLSAQTILKIADIFAWNINFKKDLRPKDRITVIFDDYYAGDNKVKDGSIVAIRLTNKGKVYEAIRHVLPNGKTAYYRPDGSSLAQAFIRRPLKYTRISSHFSSQRKHPILGIVRKHTGVDYAAPAGTPVKASGDGIVSFLGWKGGYGRTVMLQHGKTYTTLYAHFSKFAEKLYTGKKVLKGQVIGYVGKSGLATAPHLHYEFWVKGIRVNPETVKLPLDQPVNGQEKELFLANAKDVIDQLRSYEQQHNNQ